MSGECNAYSIQNAELCVGTGSGRNRRQVEVEDETGEMFCGSHDVSFMAWRLVTIVCCQIAI
jgi:hypothetical protein